MNTAQPKHSPLKVILVAGLIAGTLDIIAALTQFYIKTDKNPEIVLKYIASGILGRKEAMTGGIGMSILGLFLHYIIATLFAAFFVFIYLRWKLISKNIVLSGLLYGVFVWIIMSQVVVPMSNVVRQPFEWNLSVVISILILMFFIGLPIALVTRRYFGAKRF